MNYDRIGAALALGGLVISIWVAVDQSNKTRSALFETRVQARIATCIGLAESYGSQSWQYPAIQPKDFSLYGLPDDTPYYDPEVEGFKQPNQVLAEFHGKALASARASQICLNEHVSESAIALCLTEDVDQNQGHWVDDDLPRDGKVDRIIC